MQTVQLEDFPTEMLRAGSEINVLVGEADPDMVDLMFEPLHKADKDPDEVLIQTDRDITWPRLLAALDCFPSVTQAKKNWCDGQKRPLEIERGYKEVNVGKARKIKICLYKPFVG